MKKQSLVIVILILFGILIAMGVKASPQLKDDYPRLANYYLKYFGDVSVAELNNLKNGTCLFYPMIINGPFLNF